MIQHGLSPNSPNKYNVTPLHIACKQQLVEVCKLLIEKGGSSVIDHKDNSGMTPLHYAVSGVMRSCLPEVDDVPTIMGPDKFSALM